VANVIIETPKATGNKYKYDAESGLFKLSRILPEGMVFPLHFGFIPHTAAQDGDPVDALVLMDEAAYPGCLIECRLLGVIEATQTEGSETTRNDRIITAALQSRRYATVTSIKELEKQFIDDLTGFFAAYNKMDKITFTPLGVKGPSAAARLIRAHISRK